MSLTWVKVSLRDRRALLFWSAVAIGSIVVAATTIRGFFIQSDVERVQRERQREVATAIAQGQRAYRTVQMEPLQEVDSPEALRSRFLAMWNLQATASRLSRTEAETLLSLAAELVYYRFVQESHEVYVQQFLSWGYRMKDPAELRRAFVHKDFEHLFGERYPGDDHLEHIFQRMWMANRIAWGGNSRPRALASGPEGLAIGVGWLDRGEQLEQPRLSGPLSEEYWHGLTQGGLRLWWADPRGGVREELRRQERVPIAMVGVLMEFPGGDRYPFTISFYRDRKGKWWIWRLNILNVAPDRFVMIEI
jgi:hypothetical protein